MNIHTSWDLHVKRRKTEMKTIREVMDMPIENLELSVRCINCFNNKVVLIADEAHHINADTRRLKGAAKKEEDFYNIRNMGKTSVGLLKDLLSSLGMCFCMTDRDWLQWGLMNKEWILTH